MDKEDKTLLISLLLNPEFWASLNMFAATMNRLFAGLVPPVGTGGIGDLSDTDGGESS
jgi:hypothetical protein